MSDERMSEPIETPPEEELPQNVHVTSYPKIIFLWPTWVISFILWLIAFFVDETLAAYEWMGWLWIGIFAFNLFVVAFDFAAGKFLAIIALIFVFFILVFLGIIPLNIDFPHLKLSEEFFLSITIIFTFIMAILWISRRFNYLEITHQQITYHVGIMADERRYPAPECRFEKKTEDVFERIMPPFCSKLIMKTDQGEVAEILECVPRINKRLSDIKKILDHLKVIQSR